MRNVFLSSLGIVAYTYLAFPFLLMCRARLHRRGGAKEAPRLAVSVLIAARNEQSVIAGKLESILRSGYPPQLLEVIVATNGCTDATADVVRCYEDRGVRLLSLPAGGKAAALDAAAAVARGEVFVFTDANGVLEAGALRALVEPFGDPKIGGVAGDQQFVDDRETNALGSGERRYWRIERFLKRQESAAGDVISATGGLYAIRREFYEAIPPAVTDDAFLSMGVVSKGARLVFAEKAVVREPLTSAPRAEFSRKVRIINRGLRTLWARRELLNPFRYGFYALQLWSHKLLRRLMFLPLSALLVTSISLAGQGMHYRSAAGAQVGFWALGVVGLLLARTGLAQTPILSFPAHFVATNAAAAVAFAGLLGRRSISVWQPERTSGRPSQPATMQRRPEVRRRAERAVALAAAIATGVVAGARPSVVLAVVALAAGAAVLSFRADLAALVALGLLYSNAVVLAIERYGAPVAVAAAVPALLLVPLADALVVRRLPFVVPAALPFIAGYGVVQVLSTAQAADKGRALGALATFGAEGLGLYLLLTNVLRSREMLLRCFRVLIVVGVAISVLIVFRAATGDFTNDFGGFAQARTPEGFGADSVETEDLLRERGGYLRQTGPLDGPGRFAQYWLPLVPVALLLARLARSRRGALTLGLAALLVIAAVVFTFTRGAFVGLVITGVMLALVRIVRPSVLVVGAAVLVGFIAVVPAYRDRVRSISAISGLLSGDSSGADSSFRGRFTENAAAVYMFRDHPFVGVGPANYSVLYRRYANFEPTNVRAGGREAHSLYLGVVAENGSLGLAVVLGAFGATLWELVRARRRAQDADGNRIASVSIVMVVSLMVTGAFLHLAFIRYFWMFMALAAVGAKVSGENVASQEDASGTRAPVGAVS